MSPSNRNLWLLVLAAALLAPGCAPERPQISFMEEIGDPPDFAALESAYPLTREERESLIPKNLAAFDQNELDQIYARLAAGPIPDGPYRGTIIFAEGGGPKELAARLGKLAEGVVDVKLLKLDFLGEALWKGKVFYKSDRLLRNQIDHEDVVRRLFDVPDGAMIREEIGGREVALLFPAELYCGDSLLDGRRDSVIIDYADTERLPGYIPEVDYLAGRDKLRVRDEIRMIRPGLYLGKAYLREKFVLTFTLHNEEVEAAGLWPQEEECWDGTGPRPQPESEAMPEPPLEETTEEPQEPVATG